MELGQDSVQGTDYAYMIPGYHEKDFFKLVPSDSEGSGSVYDSSHSTTSSWHVPNSTFLYNGNLVPSVCEGISSWSSNSRRASGATDTALASVYHYELLNRIRSDSTRLRGATAWSAVGSHWQSDYTYDGNGNIKTLYRANASGSQMDNLTYAYTSGTNKLVNIDDSQGASTGADIGDQGGNNYAYDATGNMTQDTAAGIEAGGIVWSPYNKIKSTTWYVRDARGNTLATYTKPSDSTTARQKEVMLYGSTRLAVAETHAPYSDSETDTLGIFDRVSSRTLGEKRYELTDHLGNVRATVSDVVIDHSGNLDAEISTRTDYYPFGMIMGSRNSSLDDAHRYGFNGKENDNEVKGEGVQRDYGFRIYDARVARFLSVDPLTKSYPSWSPYPFAMNRVIDGVDLDGLEWVRKVDANGDIETGANGGYTWAGESGNTVAPEGSVPFAFYTFNDESGAKTRYYATEYKLQDNSEGETITVMAPIEKEFAGAPEWRSLSTNDRIELGGSLHGSSIVVGNYRAVGIRSRVNSEVPVAAGLQVDFGVDTRLQMGFRVVQTIFSQNDPPYNDPLPGAEHHDNLPFYYTSALEAVFTKSIQGGSRYLFTDQPTRPVQQATETQWRAESTILAPNASGNLAPAVHFRFGFNIPAGSTESVVTPLEIVEPPSE
jgi:RHS repeat-associated protein